MVKAIREIRAYKKAKARQETQLAIDAIMGKVLERCEMVEKYFVRGKTVAFEPVVKSDCECVLKGVRSVLERSQAIPVWTDIDVSVRNGSYRIRIMAY